MKNGGLSHQLLTWSQWSFCIASPRLIRSDVLTIWLAGSPPNILAETCDYPRWIPTCQMCGDVPDVRGVLTALGLQGENLMPTPIPPGVWLFGSGLLVLAWKPLKRMIVGQSIPCSRRPVASGRRARTFD